MPLPRREWFVQARAVAAGGQDDKIDKVAAMKKTYKDAKLDCLLCLGGNGTHKTANTFFHLTNPSFPLDLSRRRAGDIWYYKSIPKGEMCQEKIL